MPPNSVKMFHDETTAESDKCIDAVTHTGKEICKIFLSFSSLEVKTDNLKNLKYCIWWNEQNRYRNVSWEFPTFAV